MSGRADFQFVTSHDLNHKIGWPVCMKISIMRFTLMIRPGR